MNQAFAGTCRQLVIVTLALLQRSVSLLGTKALRLCIYRVRVRSNSEPLLPIRELSEISFGIFRMFQITMMYLLISAFQLPLAEYHYIFSVCGEDPATKLDDFLEKIQTPFDPPLHFSKIILHFL